MSVVEDMAVTAINQGLNVIFKVSPVDVQTAAKGMQIAGAALIDLGKKLEDGKLDQAEINDVLAVVQAQGNGPWMLAIKSFINRVVEHFAGKSA